jgi:hypothetical protein
MLFNAQGGACALCAISEEMLQATQTDDPDDWASDHMLHIDHDHQASTMHVRGLLCASCNFELEATVRNRSVIHPGGRGVSEPARKVDRKLAIEEYLIRSTLRK